MVSWWAFSWLFWIEIPKQVFSSIEKKRASYISLIYIAREALKSQTTSFCLCSKLFGKYDFRIGRPKLSLFQRRALVNLHINYSDTVWRSFMHSWVLLMSHITPLGSFSRPQGQLQWLWVKHRRTVSKQQTQPRNSWLWSWYCKSIINDCHSILLDNNLVSQGGLWLPLWNLL